MSEHREQTFPIPITVIAGFLGAGKTTLLNRILQAEHGRRLAVLVNDFGEINIDTQLLADAQADNMISLPNGCICCTLFGNLVKVVKDLAQLPQPPEHIIIEASGVASPKEIVAILEAPNLRPLVFLDGVVTLVDAENVRRIAPMVMFIESQINSADLLLVNKIDTVGQKDLLDLIDWLRDIAPEARLVPTTYAQVPLDLVLGTGDNSRWNFNDVALPDEKPPLEGEHDHHHEPQHRHKQLYGTWAYTTTKPLSRPAVQAVIDNLPVSVYRAKGILYFADEPQHRYVLQVVGKRVRLFNDGDWGQKSPQSQLVFIGQPDALDPVELKSSLNNCVST